MRRPAAALLMAFLATLSLTPTVAGASEPEGEHTAQGGAGKELLFKWLNFILVFGGLGYFLRKPMQQVFSRQRAAIRSAIQEAREARERSQARLTEVEQRLARLELDVEALRREATENAAAERQRIREAARREADRILATTRAEVDSSTRAARLELRAYTARLAVALAEKNIQQQLTPETHAALFQAFVGDSAAPRAHPPRAGSPDKDRRQ